LEKLVQSLHQILILLLKKWNSFARYVMMVDMAEQTMKEIIDVLKFYAKKENYYDTVEFGQNLISEVDYDMGVKARVALSTIEARKVKLVAK
jgi:hypothetical protein